MPLGANHARRAGNLSGVDAKACGQSREQGAPWDHRNPQETVWLTDRTGQRHQRIPVLVDATMLQDWCGLVARGLAFFHWGVATPDYMVETIPLAAEDEQDILALAHKGKGGLQVEHSVGNGAFAYRAFKGADGEPASMWLIQLYGSMPMVAIRRHRTARSELGCIHHTPEPEGSRVGRPSTAPGAVSCRRSERANRRTKPIGFNNHHLAPVSRLSSAALGAPCPVAT